MIALLQRVSRSRVVIDGTTPGAIARGLLVSQVTLTNDGPAAEVES